MKVLRVALAIVLTVVMLYVTRTNSLGEPEFFSHKENGFDFQITTVPKQLEDKSTALTVQVTGPISPETQVYFRSAVKGAISISVAATARIMVSTTAPHSVNMSTKTKYIVGV